MNYLIFGNMGYVGPCLVKYLKNEDNVSIVGYDNGYFAHCLTGAKVLPEIQVDKQYFGDVREISPNIFEDIDSVVYLAAISNDPMGDQFAQPTFNINYESAIEIAKLAKSSGVKNFVYASSCSMYGAAEDRPRVESDEQHPLTAYAKSKVYTENELQKIADENMAITSLRFCTACGMSDRLRLDLVLNDFVASAITNKKIQILSDGTPWRPLIHVNDMARAISWAAKRYSEDDNRFLAINVGRNDWNYQIKDLAYAVAGYIQGVDVEINTNAAPDKRSYKVNFDLYKSLAPDYQPVYNLEDAVKDLVNGLSAMQFDTPDFRNTWFMRLKVLNEHIAYGRLNTNLEWNIA